MKIFWLFLVLTTACGVSDPRPSQLDEFQDHNITHFGLTGSKTVSLTFDDGPSKYTDSLLDILAEEGISATFFVLGDHLKGHTAILERMLEEGHIVANHTRTHGDLRKVSPKVAESEIAFTYEGSKDYIGNHRLYFRAPYGAWTKRHVDRLNSNPDLQNYIGPIFWDAGGDTAFDRHGKILSAADWECWSKKRSISTCRRGYEHEIKRKQGGVVLMHDITSKTIRMVKSLIPKLKQDGYDFVNLDEVSELDQYEWQ